MIFQNLKKFIYLIDRQITGNPQEAAKKIEVSERTIHNYCHLIRNELGAPLVYDKFRGTYIFDGPGELVWEWLEGFELICEEKSFKNKRLNCMNEIVKRSKEKKTGSVKTLAEYLNISERNLHYYIETLKLEFNVPLYFDRKLNSYALQTSGCLYFSWREN
jgi:transcriptional antiterminator